MKFIILLICTVVSLTSVKGNPAEEGQFPFIAAVTGVSRELLIDIHTCGGYILSGRWILSEALCSVGVETLRVRLGATNFSDPASSFETDIFHTHPDWDEDSGVLGYNLLLIWSPSLLVISDEVQPIDLPWLFVGHDFLGYPATYATLINIGEGMLNLNN